MDSSYWLKGKWLLGLRGFANKGHGKKIFKKDLERKEENAYLCNPKTTDTKVSSS
jgi:hypothetical protein